jgi:hypothetical protein
MTTLLVPNTPGGQAIFCQPYIPLGYAQYTSLGSSTLLTATPQSGVALPAGATACLISCEVSGVRYRDDGVAPTATIGMQMTPTGSPLLYAGALSAIQFIQSASGAILNVLYYR